MLNTFRLLSLIQLITQRQANKTITLERFLIKKAIKLKGNSFVLCTGSFSQQHLLSISCAIHIRKKLGLNFHKKAKY